MVNGSLEDATSVSVGSDFDQVGSDGVVDELVVFRYKLVQALLDDLRIVSTTTCKVCELRVTDVVTVQILDEGDDIHRQSVDQSPNLFGLPGRSEEIDHLLNGSSTVHVERDPNKIISNRLDDGSSLLVGRVFQEFLTEVISEWVRHEFWEMTIGLSENHVSVCWFPVFKLLLEVSTSVLILAEVEEFAL